MFDRFSDDTREVMILAQDEARDLGHDHIGTEHLLLGLLRAEDPIVRRLGLDVETARARVEQVVGPRGPRTIGELQFTGPAKRALETALRQALRVGDEHIRPEHLFSGLIMPGQEGGIERILMTRTPSEPDDDAELVLRLAEEPSTVTARALADVGVEPDALREAVERVRRRSPDDPGHARASGSAGRRRSPRR
jgi:Clp amino terminal domain, pathogenicity island component